jgi:hypothetical protein
MYEDTDRRGRTDLSARLALPRRHVVLAEEASEGDPVWEVVLVEGQDIKACCEPVPFDAAPVAFGAR